MAMSKKDFIRLAEYLQIKNLGMYCSVTAKGGRMYVNVDELYEHLANFCHAQNPAFKRERWIGYIKGENGPNGGKV